MQRIAQYEEELALDTTEDRRRAFLLSAVLQAKTMIKVYTNKIHGASREHRKLLMTLKNGLRDKLGGLIAICCCCA